MQEYGHVILAKGNDTVMFAYNYN